GILSSHREKTPGLSPPGRFYAPIKYLFHSSLITLWGGGGLPRGVEVGPRGLVARQERAQVAGHAPAFLQRQRAPHGRQDGPAPTQDAAHQRAGGARALPARVGEARPGGDAPAAPAVHAVTANAVPVIQADDHAPLLVRAAHPVPGPAGLTDHLV